MSLTLKIFAHLNSVTYYIVIFKNRFYCYLEFMNYLEIIMMKKMNRPELEHEP